MSIDILCIHCNACGHRAALGNDKLPIYRGNMTRLRDLKMLCEKCRTRGTALKQFTFYIPFTASEVEAFLTGDEIARCKVEV